MIYDQVDKFTPNLKMHKEGYLLLDLSILQKPAFKSLYKEIAQVTKTQENVIASRFADTLLSPEDLNLRLKAVILPYNCFDRKFKPIDQLNEYPAEFTVYQFLRKKYESYLSIGIKIDLKETQRFQQIWQQKSVKKIKLFSFNLTQSQMEKQLPCMTKYVKQLFSETKKIHFHIKIEMESVSALKRLKQQFIKQQYPIEYCMIETNLINVVQRRFKLRMQQSWEEIAFKYTKAASKYVSPAIGCLLQAYQSDKSNTQISSILMCLNHINHRNDRQQKQYKNYHNTGMGSIEPLLILLLQDYTPEQYGHFRVKGDWGMYLGQLNDVLVGKYESKDKIMFQHVVQK